MFETLIELDQNLQRYDTFNFTNFKRLLGLKCFFPVFPFTALLSKLQIKMEFYLEIIIIHLRIYINIFIFTYSVLFFNYIPLKHFICIFENNIVLIVWITYAPAVVTQCSWHIDSNAIYV